MPLPLPVPPFPFPLPLPLPLPVPFPLPFPLPFPFPAAADAAGEAAAAAPEAPEPAASRSACAARPCLAASRPLIAAAIAWSLLCWSWRESSCRATSLNAPAAAATSPVDSADEARWREAAIVGSCACCAASASAFASCACCSGVRLFSWEARSRSAWAPLDGLNVRACPAACPAVVALREAARFWAVLVLAGV